MFLGQISVSPDVNPTYNLLFGNWRLKKYVCVKKVSLTKRSGLVVV